MAQKFCLLPTSVHKFDLFNVMEVLYYMIYKLSVQLLFKHLCTCPLPRSPACLACHTYVWSHIHPRHAMPQDNASSADLHSSLLMRASIHEHFQKGFRVATYPNAHGNITDRVYKHLVRPTLETMHQKSHSLLFCDEHGEKLKKKS